MRYARLIVILCLLPAVSWSQIRIDRASFYFSNIPVLYTYKSYDVYHTSTKIQGFGYSIDSAIVVRGDTVSFSIQSEGGGNNFTSWTNVSFRIDTVTKRLHKFIYDSGTREDIGRNDEAWTTKSASFDSIDLFRDGNLYRGRMSGALLAANHVNIVDGSYSEYSVGFINENSYVSIASAFSDTSALEVVLTGESPLDVSNSKTVSSLAVYPNPTTDILTVNSSEASTTFLVEVMDQFGRKQAHPIISTSPNLVLDVSKLPTGCYWIRLGVEIQKFIKH